MANTCYLCGTDLDARTIALVDKLQNDDLTEAEMAELNTLDCANGCWTKEEAAEAAEAAIKRG